MKDIYVARFIDRATEVHGGKYDYREVVFKENSRTVTVICCRHGKFEIAPASHLRGVGCQNCKPKPHRCSTFESVAEKAEEAETRLELFIKQSEKAHGKGTFNYDKTKFYGSQKELTVTCPKHGDFEVIAFQHYGKKKGCPACDKQKIREKELSTGFSARGTVVTVDKFIELANKKHGEGTYDYSKVRFVKIRDKVTIICPYHGEFNQSAYRHYSVGSGCPKCSRINAASKATLNNEKFIARANKLHGEGTYDYSKVVYVSSVRKVIIICPKHGEFKQVARTHLNGMGCAKCHNERTSIRMREIRSRFNANKQLPESILVTYIVPELKRTL